MEIYEEIFNVVETLEIVDTHEHLVPFEEEREQETDLLKEYLSSYFTHDLISAGLTQKDYEQVIDIRLPLMERWKLVEPYWEAAKRTGYGRALDISVKELYGAEKICSETVEAINEKFLETLQKGRQYRLVLQEKSKIITSLLDCFQVRSDPNVTCDRTYFSPVYRLDHFIFPRTTEHLHRVENESGVTICAFDDWLDALEIVLEKVLQGGAVALKTGLAYDRSLQHDRVCRKEAEESFLKILPRARIQLHDEKKQSIDPGKKFQDYMMHAFLRLLNRKGLTLQVHTGLLAGNGNILTNADPTLLSNLFLQYPDVKFDLFHIGYPYHHLIGALAKIFPNVYIDMCWAHIISPTACVNALTEWLDVVPVNKISAFGGDYGIIDAVYGHQQMARVNVSKALAQKVKEGNFDVDEACQIAQWLFHDNPLRIFNLA